MFGVGDALEHEPQRDIAKKLAVGKKRRRLFRGRRGEGNWNATTIGEKIHAKNVAHRALGRSVAANKDYGNLRLAKA